MTAGVPQEEASELFNAVAEAGADNPEELAKLQWNAMKAVKQSPSSFTARVSNAAVLICTGQRADGLTELQVAYNLRAQGQIVEKDMFASLCYFTGAYSRASEMYKDILSSPEIKRYEPIAAKATICAILSGDMGLLSLPMEFDEPLATTAHQTLCDNAMLEYFSDHQKIVHDIISGGQCRADAIVVVEGAEQPMISARYFVLGDRKARAGLSRDVHDALENFYRSRGMSPSYYLGKLQTSLLPMPLVRGVSVAA